MKILALESTAKVASCALCDDEKLLGVTQIDAGLTQSEILLPMAEDLLRAAHLSFADIGLYACTVGPGSFTGVRIGVATVKGLAFGKNVPCVAVSALESLAQNLFPLDGIYAACMDARRGQVYNALFRAEGGKLVRLCEDRALSVRELLNELAAAYAGEVIRFVGDGYDAVREEADKTGFPYQPTPLALRAQSAASCAAVAYRKYLAGETVSDRQLAPTYLRLPQAERERLERQQNA